MLKQTSRETSAALENSLLSAKVCKVLYQRSKRGGPIPERDQHTLRDGVALLERIIAGSLLVEPSGKGTREIQPRESGLRPFERALSVTGALAQGEYSSYGELFVRYRDILIAVSECNQMVSSKEMRHLAAFFDKLGSLFYSDLNTIGEGLAAGSGVAFIRWADNPLRAGSAFDEPRLALQ